MTTVREDLFGANMAGRSGVPVSEDERCRGYPVEDWVRHDAPDSET